MPRPVKVLFVCLHGSAKSVIAARHLERLAAAQSLAVESSSAGLEADMEFPPHVVAGLAVDGIDICGAVPAQATAELVAGADLVVSLGCDLAGLGDSGRAVTWHDVPAVSDGFKEAREAIVTRLKGLLDTIRELATPPTPR